MPGHVHRSKQGQLIAETRMYIPNIRGVMLYMYTTHQYEGSGTLFGVLMDSATQANKGNHSLEQT